MTASQEIGTGGTGARSTMAEVPPWAAGLAAFAGAMMIVSGAFGALSGIAALFENDVYVAGPRYVYAFDVTTWGWVHLIVGVLVVVAGVAVLAGRLWARIVGILLASLSMLAHFLWLPYYPVWALAVIALDVVVIWALCIYTSDAAS